MKGGRVRDPSPHKPAKLSASIDPRRMYLSRLREIVDLDVIKKAG